MKNINVKTFCTHFLFITASQCPSLWMLHHCCDFHQLSDGFHCRDVTAYIHHTEFFWKLKHNFFSPFEETHAHAFDPDVWQMTPSPKHDARENTSSQPHVQGKTPSQHRAVLHGWRDLFRWCHYIPPLYSMICRRLQDEGICVDAFPAGLRCMESGGRHAARLQKRQLPQSSVCGSFQPKH